MDYLLKEELLNKIKTKKAIIGVIGLGYVGLPLAVEKAKAGFSVIGFDVQTNKVDMVNQGHNYIGDIVDSDLNETVELGKLKATSDFSFVKEVDCIAICVPTPIDKHLEPDTSYIEQSSKDIAKYLHHGMLIVLESTTYPGTTEQLVKPILESSGLVCNKDFYLAFSPERVDPGNLVYKTKNTPKVVGGIGKDSTEVAAALYRSILESDVFEVSSPSVAEMEKILENTFRNINIGLINEMAILCSRMEIDVWEVIEAAKTKPYGFMPFYPGPGLGGHCIPIDPYYLTWKAREYNYHTRLIETASEINNYMPEFVVERSMKILNRLGKCLKNSKILLLGVAYKQDVDDIRESPALKVIECLEKFEAKVFYNDPFIPSFNIDNKLYQSTKITSENLKEMDLIIITTMHTCYDYNFIQENSSYIFDTKNAMKYIKNRYNIEKL